MTTPELSRANSEFDRKKRYVEELERDNRLDQLTFRYYDWDDIDPDELSPDRAQEWSAIYERLRGYAGVHEEQQDVQREQRTQRQERERADSYEGRLRARLDNAHEMAVARLPANAGEDVIRDRAMAYLHVYDDVYGGHGSLGINYDAVQTASIEDVLDLMSSIAEMGLSRDPTPNLRRAAKRAQMRDAAREYQEAETRDRGGMDKSMEYRGAPSTPSYSQRHGRGRLR